MKVHETKIEISKIKSRLIIRLMKKTEIFTKLIRDIESGKTSVNYAKAYLTELEYKNLNKIIELQQSIDYTQD